MASPTSSTGRCWDQVGDYLRAALQEAFSGGSPGAAAEHKPGCVHHTVADLGKAWQIAQRQPATVPITLLIHGLQAWQPVP